MNLSKETLFIVLAVIAIILFAFARKQRKTLLLFYAIKGWGNLEMRKVNLSHLLLRLLCVVAGIVVFYAVTQTDVSTLQRVGKFFASSILFLGVHQIFMNKYFCVHNIKKYPFRRI